MNPLKKATALFLCAMMACTLAACGGGQPAAEPTPVPSGTAFSDAELGVSFIYPEGWTLVTVDTLENPDFAKLMQDTLGMSMDEVKNALLQTPVIFYDTNRITEEFISNANMVVTDAPGMTQAAMRKLTNEELEENLVPQLDSLNVTWVEKPTVQESNGVAYYTCIYTHNMMGAPMTACQITTGDKGKVYTFTYTALGDSIEAGALADLQQVIDTLKFL